MTFGLRMGIYYDIVHAHFKQQKSSQFFVVWITDRMLHEEFLEQVGPMFHDMQENVDNMFNSGAEVMIQLFCLDCYC